jgi:DNA-binding PadR family transcriptional regulator
MWLRREAAWADREVCHNRQTIYLQMRQVLVTVNSLVKQWGVSKPTVIRFLQRLEQEKLIEREIDTRKTIITITPLGWADLEVKPVVKSEVKPAVNIDHEVDRQAYHSHLLYRENNIIAGGQSARDTREEAVANNLELEFEKDDFDEVVVFFNEQMKGKKIPQVAVKTPERRQAYTRLIAETQLDIDSVKQAIKNAAESDFLNGSGQKGWIADFDWIMVPQHFLKVLENFYRNKQITQTYGTANGYQDPRRGVEASRTDSFAAGYDRPL